MKKKNNRGFSLVEIMVALGIMSALLVVLNTAQKSSMTSTGDLAVTSEVNNLIQLLTSELSRVETCNKNFGTTAIGAARTSIKNKSGQNIITAGAAYGKELTIQAITTAAGAGNVMELTITYLPQKKTAQNFKIPINVFMDGAGIIKSCFSDVQTLLKNAVQNACDTSNGYVFTAGTGTGIGTCDVEFKVQDSAGGAISDGATPGKYFCPTGEFLQRVDVTTTPGSWIFKCKSATTASCPSWQYLESFDANGDPVCKDLRDLTPSSGTSGIMFLEAGTYKSVALDCGLNANGVKKILLKINADGTPSCVDPTISVSCPVNQFVSNVTVDAQGKPTPTCSTVAPATACSANSYMTAVNADGSITCRSGVLTCGSAQYISGIDASANPVCVNMN